MLATSAAVGNTTTVVGAMAEDEEVDWDSDILPSSKAASDTRAIVVRANARDSVDVLQKQLTVKAAPSQWTVVIPPRLQRNHLEKCLAASRMRDAKGRIKSATDLEKSAEDMQAMLSKLRESGCLRDHGRT